MNTKNLLSGLESLGVYGPLNRFGVEFGDIKEVTSSIQKKRCNIKFYDPQTDAYYVSYANGYVRREFVRDHFLGFGYRYMYTLNQRIKNQNGDKVIQLEMDPEKRIQIVVKGIRNFRKNSPPREKKFDEAMGRFFKRF